ncbi:hypothetical protein BO97DRAFT_353144, partial [Aspergillus homomorphus CBS 101889]
LAHTTTGCGKQGFPSAQPYLSHTPGANPFCCMFFFDHVFLFLRHQSFSTEYTLRASLRGASAGVLGIRDKLLPTCIVANASRRDP